MELRQHIDDIAEKIEEIGVVILCGKGRSFSAGNDLKAIQAGELAPTPYFQAETLEAIEALPQPASKPCPNLSLRLFRAIATLAHWNLYWPAIYCSLLNRPNLRTPMVNAPCPPPGV
jgi:hypothetical protein